MWAKGYQELTDELPAELKHFPPIDTAAVTEYANRLFTPYLFKRRDSRHGVTELQCSLCGATMTVHDGSIPTKAMNAVYAGHNEGTVCPACGELMTAKHIGKLGQRKGLAEWHPLLILTERDGEIYARGYWTRKLYLGKLTARPQFMPTAFYRFAPGRAEVYKTYYGRIEREELQGGYNPARRVINEPFTTGGYMGGYEPYAVYGMDGIDRSFARYCGRETTCPGYLVEWGTERVRVQSDLCKFLSLCCIYPRQVEMLNKTGFAEIVDETVKGRRKCAAVFNWRAESYKDAFGLTKQELRAWRASGAPIDAIADYKRFRRAGQPADFAQLAAIYRGYCDKQKFFAAARRAGLAVPELHRYLTRQANGSRTASLTWMFGLLADYYDIAQRLGWELGSAAAPWTPRDLHAKHDEAAEEERLLLERRRSAELAAKQAAAEESLARRREKYNAERDGYIIRIADTAEEIRLEGQTLHHCVGGYAERHLADRLTICFIRRAETPSAALYTVEMQGNRMIQIHGYKNDVDKPADQRPEAVMAWLLEPWLEWLRRGSPRDRSGQPKWPKIKTKKKEKNAA